LIASLESVAGLNPTNGSQDPQDPAVSGGDAFDLDTLGLSVIRYIRLTDSEGLFVDGGVSFDFDAVVGINSRPILTAIEPSASTKENATLSLKNFPNPFNLTTTFNYSLSKSSPVRLTVYNTVGQELVTLVNEVQAEGRYSITWDGRDKSGSPLTSGVYLYRLVSAGLSETRKMILAK